MGARGHLLPIPLLVATLATACGDESSGTAGDRDAEAYIALEETWIQLGPADNALDSPWLFFHVDRTSWEIKEGEDWNTADDVATYDVDSSDGVRIGGDLLLPDKPSEGDEEDGVTVLSIGPEETYYGTFPDAIRVDVAEGVWAGEQVFAPGLGLVWATYDGEEWQLVYYQ